MKHVYWVREGELAGRAGPIKYPWDAAELAKGGIGAIVSLDGPVPVEPLAAANIRHLPLYQPMIVLSHPRDQKKFLSNVPTVLKFFEECRQEGRGVMVHCYYGCDRTGAMLACCLLALENLTAPQAVHRVRQGNPYAMAIEGYDQAVYMFERERNKEKTRV